MKKELMLLAGLAGITGMALSAAMSETLVLADGRDVLTEPRTKRRRSSGRPLGDPRPESKDKSGSLRRMLKNKGRK